MQGKDQYFIDRELGFPGGNRYVREGCDCERNNANENTTEMKKTRELYTAIVSGNTSEVQALLRKGYDPNFCLIDITMLTAAIYHTFSFGKRTKAALDITLLLLIYGGDPTQPSYQNRTSFDFAVNYAEKNELIPAASNMIRLLTGSKKARHAIQRHNNDQSPFAKLVEESAYITQLRNCRVNTRYNIFHNPNMQLITTITGDQLRVISEPIERLNRLGAMCTLLKKHSLWNDSMSHEEMIGCFYHTFGSEDKKTCVDALIADGDLTGYTLSMYKLFKKSYPWQGNIDENDLPVRFYNDFMLPEGSKFADLIFIKNKVAGFNIDSMIEYDKYGKTITDSHGKRIIFHRVCLALGVSPLVGQDSPFKRVMSLISSQRGFVKMRQNEDARVITVFEAASEDSFYQTYELDCIPMYTHSTETTSKSQNLTSLAPKLYQAQNQSHLLVESKRALYTKEPYEYKRIREENEWLEPRDLFIKFYDMFLAKPGHCLIVAFENNHINFRLMSALINLHLIYTTYGEIINKQVSSNPYSLRAKQ